LWVTIGAGCPVRYLLDSDGVTFVYGNGRHDFEFFPRTGALRATLTLGAQALAELDAAGPVPR
jgi:hypothetical protein